MVIPGDMAKGFTGSYLVTFPLYKLVLRGLSQSFAEQVFLFHRDKQLVWPVRLRGPLVESRVQANDLSCSTKSGNSLNNG